MTGPQIRNEPSGAFYAQSVASFVISAAAVVTGIFYLHVDAWERAFLGIGMLYVITSAFTLAKVIRDRQQAGEVVTRVDQARLDKLLAEHDPFKAEV